MLLALVKHRHNPFDHGIYIGENDNTIRYFHHLGYFYQESKESYLIKDFVPQDIEIWLGHLQRYLFRFEKFPVLKEILLRRKAKLEKNLLQIRSSFKLTVSDTCPICLDTFQDTDVYSYHQNHQLHWACQACYRKHTRNQPLGSRCSICPICPICRLGF